MNDADLDRIAARLRDAERGTSFTCTDKDRRDAADAIAQLRAECDAERKYAQTVMRGFVAVSIEARLHRLATRRLARMMRDECRTDRDVDAHLRRLRAIAKEAPR